MNKSDFNKMNIQDQVRLLNDELKKNTEISVTRLCKQFGLAKSTVIDRFTKAGYKYNHDIRQYVKKTDIIQNDNKSKKSQSTVDQANSNHVIQNDSKSIISESVINQVDSNEVIQNNTKSIIHKKSNIPEISSDQIKGLLELLEIKDQLKELIQNNNNNINNIDLYELRIDKSKFNGDLKGRLIKVYENVNVAWIKFCKANAQFKMQDLYSMALLEFMDKYKKDVE